MIIGTLKLALYFEKPQSLKEKRMILKSLVTRLRQKFNISVSEIGDLDLWQSSVIGISAVGGEQKHVNQVLNHVLDFIHEEDELQVTKEQMEFF